MKTEKAKHTPLPWSIMEEKPFIIKMPEPCNIGPGNKYCAVGGGNNEINAAYIVEACNNYEKLQEINGELLDAISYLTSQMVEVVKDKERCGGVPSSYYESVRKASAAIARARKGVK